MIRPTLYKRLGSWLLAIFFTIGGLVNLFATEQVQQDYINWGYPSWFHYVTAALELSTALLLLRRKTLLAGSALGGAVMISAAATVLRDGAYSHALLPLTVLSLTALNAWFSSDNSIKKRSA